MPPLSQADLLHDHLVNQLEMALESLHANKGKITSLVILLSQDNSVQTWSSGMIRSTIRTLLTAPQHIIAQLLTEEK